MHLNQLFYLLMASSISASKTATTKNPSARSHSLPLQPAPISDTVELKKDSAVNRQEKQVLFKPVPHQNNEVAEKSEDDPEHRVHLTVSVSNITEEQEEPKETRILAITFERDLEIPPADEVAIIPEKLKMDQLGFIEPAKDKQKEASVKKLSDGKGEPAKHEAGDKSATVVLPKSETKIETSDTLLGKKQTQPKGKNYVTSLLISEEKVKPQ